MRWPDYVSAARAFISPRLHWWTLLLVTFLAFAARLYHLDFQSLWRDEVDALVFASRDLNTVFANFTKIGENGPLYFLALRIWIVGAGTSEFSLRFFSLFFGVLVVPLIYTMARHLLNREVAILAAILAAASPYYVWYSQETKMYALVTFLSLLSVHLYLQALERGGIWLWAGFVVITSLSLYVHLFSALIVVLEGLLVVLWPRRWPKGLRPWAVAFGLLTLPYLPLAVWQWPTLLHPPASAYPFLDLGTIASILTFAWSFNTGPSSSMLPALPIVFLLVAGLLLAGSGIRPALDAGESTPLILRERICSFLETRRNVIVLAAYLLVPILGYFLISLRLPLFADRYLIIASPAYYTLLACGLVMVGRRSRFALGIFFAFVLITGARGWWTQSHIEIKSDFRGAARFYAARSGSGEPIMFVAPYVRQAFAYYSGEPIPVRDVACTNGGWTSDQVAAALSGELNGDQRVWLLVSEGEACDERGLIKRWLDEHALELESIRFARVALYRYQLGPVR